MRVLLVVNPTATATTARAREVLSHALASTCRLEVAPTKAPGHAVELARSAVADGVDAVVALGGDGTVNEVVNGLLADGPSPELPALAVVPGGSTNVFARALGLPPDPVEATAVLLQALAADRRRTISLGRADQRWFTFNAGLGLDADVVRRVTSRRAAGRRATQALYVRSGFRQFLLTDRRRPALRLEREGAAPEDLGLALVCQSAPWTYLGNRAVLPCPQASFDADLDVFGLRRLGLVSTLNHLRQILARDAAPRGRQLLGLHDVPALTVRSLRGPLPLQVDGEDAGDHTVVRFTSVPGALTVVV